FLLTPVAQGGVSLEFLVDLFRQARYAGAVESTQDCTALTWFEEHRRDLFRARPPWFGRRKWEAALRQDLLEAPGVIEEANRIRGLESVLLEVAAGGKRAMEVQRGVKEITGKKVGSPSYVVWAL